MLRCLRDRDLGMFEGHPNKFRRLVYGKESFVQRLERQRCLDGHGGCVNTCAFSPDGSVLISSGDDLQVILWDWDVGKDVCLQLHCVLDADRVDLHRS